MTCYSNKLSIRKCFFPQTRDIQLPLLTKLSTANVTFPRKRVRLEAIVKKKKKKGVQIQTTPPATPHIANPDVVSALFVRRLTVL